MIKLFTCLVLVLLHVSESQVGQNTIGPLIEGLPESAFSSSSEYEDGKDTECHDEEATYTNTGSWCSNAKGTDCSDEWLEIDFGGKKEIFQVGTKGNKWGEWVTSYTLEYLSYTIGWIYYNNEQILIGNIEQTNEVRNTLNATDGIIAEKIRFHPIDASQHCSMNVEVYGYDLVTTNPTKTLTQTPTKTPTQSPTQTLTENPTKNPTKEPTQSRTRNPMQTPTKNPTKSPSINPTGNPTKNPANSPRNSPINNAINNPTTTPTKNPTVTTSNGDKPLLAKENTIDVYVYVLVAVFIVLICIVFMFVLCTCYYRQKYKIANKEQVVSKRNVKQNNIQEEGMNDNDAIITEQQTLTQNEYNEQQVAAQNHPTNTMINGIDYAEPDQYEDETAEPDAYNNDIDDPYQEDDEPIQTGQYLAAKLQKGYLSTDAESDTDQDEKEENLNNYRSDSNDRGKKSVISHIITFRNKNKSNKFKKIRSKTQQIQISASNKKQKHKKKRAFHWGFTDDGSGDKRSGPGMDMDDDNNTVIMHNDAINDVQPMEIQHSIKELEVMRKSSYQQNIGGDNKDQFESHYLGNIDKMELGMSYPDNCLDEDEEKQCALPLPFSPSADIDDMYNPLTPDGVQRSTRGGIDHEDVDDNVIMNGFILNKPLPNTPNQKRMDDSLIQQIEMNVIPQIIDDKNDDNLDDIMDSNDNELDGDSDSNSYDYDKLYDKKRKNTKR